MILNFYKLDFHSISSLLCIFTENTFFLDDKSELYFILLYVLKKPYILHKQWFSYPFVQF